MPGSTISAYVDPATAKRVEVQASREGLKPARFSANALRLYTNLTPDARRLVTAIEATATEEDMRWVMAELTRTLLRCEMALAEREVAAAMGDRLPAVRDEADLDAAAERLLSGR